MKRNSGCAVGSSKTAYPKKLQGLAYALPVMPIYFLFAPLVLLQGMYAKYFGVPLSSIAMVLLISRFFDAISDPVIGYLSDKYHDRYGSRKPLIVLGGILFILSSWFLYVPPSNVSEFYFLGWFLAFYLAYTLFEIPHLAWGGELVDTAEDKNKIYGLRSASFFLGGLFFYAVPLLPWFDSNEFTPETLKRSVFVVGILMIPTLYIAITKVPNSNWSLLKGRTPKVQRTAKRPWAILNELVSNHPLLILTISHIFTGISSSMCYTLLFFFVDAYLGLGPYFALVFTISFGISIVGLILWYKLAICWGKKVSWAIGMASVFVGMVTIGLLSPYGAGWLELLVCMTLISGGFGAFNILVPSLLSDIIDYGHWKYGSDHGAVYFSLYTFINKTIGALGGALSLTILSWYDFDPTSTSHSNEAIFGLCLAVAWIPAVMILISIFFISKISSTSHRHAIIRRRLDGRLNRNNTSSLIL